MISGIPSTYSSVDVSNRRNGVDQGKRNGLLLLCLATSAGNPTENDAVAGVDSGGEGAHGEVAGAGVGGRASEDETEDSDDFGDCDVPCSLIHPAFSVSVLIYNVM